MKANSVGVGINIYPQNINYKGKQTMPAVSNGHDKFVSDKKKKDNKTLRNISGAALISIGILSLLAIKKTPKASSNILEFKNIEQAKKYFEKIGINTDLRGAKEEHLPLLNRIKEDLKYLKDMGVKKDKPDSLVISDWSNASEYDELCRKFGINIERREGYWAFCGVSENGKSHVFINSNHPEFKKFLHEMGHSNHFIGKDSYWNAKGLLGEDFADKQLEIIKNSEKIYRGATSNNSGLDNIFSKYVTKAPAKFGFPNAEGEVRYIYAKGMIDKMYSETGCYDGGKNLSEQVADMFEGLIKGKKYSDEAMIYYDFAGGARIPNLKIDSESYDEYIESLYNNKDLIEKLKQNVKISKL